MGLLAVQGRLRRVASVRYHGLPELCTATSRADKLQPGRQQRSTRARRHESHTADRATIEPMIMDAA